MRNERQSINQIEKGFADLDFSFSRGGGSSIQIKPTSYRGSNNIYYNYYDANGRCTPIIENGIWNIDVSTTGINYTSRKSGLIDGITIENSHSYLLWGLLDDNLNSLGYGLTRWAESGFTTITSGGSKGTETQYSGLTNAYQFTIGSRVRIVNSTEWNYGYITEIVSGTSVKVLMDNESGYGNNITSTTTAYIKQFDNHRPYVVTSSSQTLYTNQYRLLGWIELGIDDSGTGGTDNRQKIMIANKWTRKRLMPVSANWILRNVVYTTAVGANGNYNIGRYVSPTATDIYYAVENLCGTGSQGWVFCSDPINNSGLGYAYQSGAGRAHENIKSRIDPNYNIRINKQLDAGTPQWGLTLSYCIEED